MKYKGCTSYLIEDRNEDLLRTFDRLMRCGGSLSVEAVYEQMSAMPAKRFWITGERAYAYIVSRNRRNEYPCRLEMCNEIEKRARKYSKEHNCSFRTACKAVVLQPAPSFYLSVGAIKNIIRRMRRYRHRRGMKDGV